MYRAACDDPRMVEYGNGVGQVAGGSGGGGGQSPDMGATLAQVFGTDDQDGAASLALQKTLVDATLINNLIQ